MTTTRRDALLDGLRGTAALAVVYFHYLYLTGLSTRPGGGHVGVVVFFVLSGYLITRGVWRMGAERPREAYGRFVRRRVVRLYPALLGVVAVAGPVSVLVGPESAREGLTAAAAALAQLTGPLHVAGLVPEGPWLHTWSLTVEWVFYLLWPIVLLALRSRGATPARARSWALGTALALFLAALPLSPLAFYYLPVGNLSAMLAGAALALTHAGPAERERRDGVVGTLALTALVLMVLLPSSTTGLWLYRVTLFPGAIALALVLIDLRPGERSPARSALESRPLAALGVASYSLYLWHLPVLWICWWAFPSLDATTRVGLALVLLVPLVAASFWLLERPWLRGGTSGAKAIERSGSRPRPLSVDRPAGNATS